MRNFQMNRLVLLLHRPRICRSAVGSFGFLAGQDGVEAVPMSREPLRFSRWCLVGYEFERRDLVVFEP